MTIKDGDWSLVSHDEAAGRTVWSMFDGRKTVFRVDYRTDEIVKANRAEMNDTPSGWRGDWHKVASVPLNIHHASGLHEAIGQRDRRFIQRFLNDSDNAAWRTKEGRI